MNVAIPEDKLVDVVELLNFVAELCECEAPMVSSALARFVACASFDAGELRIDALCHADFLARAIGFPDASMDPSSTRTRPSWSSRR